MIRHDLYLALIRQILCVITVVVLCLSMASCAGSKIKPADGSHEGSDYEKEETPIDVPPADDPVVEPDDQKDEAPIDIPPVEDTEKESGDKNDETPEKEYSINVSQLDVSLSDFYGSAYYAKGKYLLHDLSMFAVYDPAKETETEIHFKTPIIYAFDGENIYYFKDYEDGPPPEGENYDLHRFHLKNSSDKVIYTVPEGYENLWGMRCVGRFLAWNESKQYDTDAIVKDSRRNLESWRVRTKVMDLDTGRIVFEQETYIWTPYKDPRLTEDGLLTYMTREDGEYTYHIVDITTSEELWKKEHMEYPLNIGETNGKYVAYSYGLSGDVKPFYVETIEGGEVVYAASSLFSARFIDNCLITGLSDGGFRITDLDTGKKVANTADFEELYGADYMYSGWIEKAEDNQFIIIRENMGHVAKDDPLKGRWVQEIFVVTLDEA